MSGGQGAADTSGGGGGMLAGPPFTRQQQTRRRQPVAQNNRRTPGAPVAAQRPAAVYTSSTERYDALMRCGASTAVDLEIMYRERERIERQRSAESPEGRRWRRAACFERTFVRGVSHVIEWFGRVGGLLGVTAAWFILFFLCIGFWWLLFYVGVIPQSITDDDGAKTAVSEMTLIVGIIYYVWLRETLYGYTKAPTTYRAVLEAISAYTRTFYQLLRSNDLTRSGSIVAAGNIGSGGGSDDDDDDGGGGSGARVSVEAGNEAYFILQALTLYSLRLFTDHDRDLCASIHATLGGIDGLGAELAREAPTGLPADVVDGLIAMLQLRIGVLENLHILTGSDTRSLDQHLIHLRAALVEARTAYYVATPRIFRVHIFLVMVAYFLVWLPFTIYARIGLASLAIYPVFMYLLWGVFIDNWYLGSAFEAGASWTGMHTNAWRRETMQSNERAYLRWLRPHTAAAPAAERAARESAACLYRSAATAIGNGWCPPLAQYTGSAIESRPVVTSIGIDRGAAAGGTQAASIFVV